MFYRLIESSVNIPSGRSDYVAFGKGQKNLIIIQGLNVRDVKGAGASLALMYRIFAKDYRVYLFDRRKVVEKGLTNWDLAEDIYHSMKELDIRSADVFGVSQGGMIAMALALEHPECVDKLVLGVTSSRANENIKNVVGKWVDCAINKDHITINKETFSLMYTEKYLKKYRLFMPLVVRMIKPKDFDRFAILASAILDFDCYDRLNEIRCPVLVLGGDKDMITTGKASVEIADKLDCEIHMYSEYGHAAYEEAKDFNSRIYEFLANGIN
ncbi:MAG: alpha/beta hydrolase [Ruminococcaceae bacterium]|nr:alpha/beta hydrolase [Oscillospiraceae bacterium]